MRFNDIESFKINDLLLDESNYRFKVAENQKECIRKIYETNTPYFKGLMKSIAEDDLGEPLLVYQKGKVNIVADGNRRLSALKVLYSDVFAPSTSVIEYAQQLRNKHKINFDKIQAQVSRNKKLVAKTVYERHSSGKNGTSRIPWNAYAAARFGYDESIGEDKEWKIMATLSKTEEKKPSITPFLDSTHFSYEVYRRITRTAIRNKIISENIFSELRKKIKQNARRDLVQDAIQKSLSFLKAMEEKELTLSRSSGNYADQATIEEFLKQFSLSPDNAELKAAKNESNESENNDENNTESNNSNQSAQADNGGNGSESQNEEEGENNDHSSASDGQSSTSIKNRGVTESPKISEKLKQLKHSKLSDLYYSLCNVSLINHPTLMYAGAWSFLEVLARTIKPDLTTDFVSFFNQKMGSLGFNSRTIKRDIQKSIKEISDYGNAAKHSHVQTIVDGKQLRNHFAVIELLLIKLIELAIEKEQDQSNN